MKRYIKYLSIFIIIFVVGIGLLYINGNIGTTESNIENDARNSQKIKDNQWVYDIDGNVVESLHHKI